MRRLRGGLLAAALLLLAGCGSEGTDTTATPGPDAETVRTPTLAMSSHVSAAAKLPGATLTVLVTSPDGLSSPGLDAAVAVLSERPELDVVVVATDPAAADDAVGDGHTMSGFPAAVVGSGAPDPVGLAAARLDRDVDLVVVGVVEGAAIGTGIATSPISAPLDAARGLGVPALAVTAGTDHGADLAAVGLMLRSLLDVDLEALLRPGARLLTVPSCDGGLVRGPVFVAASTVASEIVSVDCQDLARAEPADDVDAHGRGFATLVDLG